ncbi:MAG: MBL fold metallo-hydrolase [Proteobacteria bacterium]|nr:MBL fold metallo-hydrolase [Pseudomonadota bacterium]MDA0992287.1 MBL fold metallo-hydrolase [Pseudomonadota bacterium]
MYRRLCILLFASSASLAQETSTIQYLANEGVMVTHGDTKVPFDPLYQNGFNNYQMVPNEVREAMFAGTAPFDGVDAVFVSHYHGDHFSAEDILRLLRSQIDTKLYAPAQAVREIRQVAGPDDESIFDRVIGLDLDYGDAPVGIDRGALTIDAVHIPHSGWPTARTDVQNIAFRVTLENNSTVLHLGDADARIVHFATDAEYWEERTIDVAFPPYWFLGSDDGIEILENRMSVGHSIGIHVPANFSDPANIPGEFSGVDLFTKPGEGRRFAGKQ